ncbi:hypothetical protein [Xanthomonas arboricola]|uniref:hypothetical protein n=1 Tax=Xanthomonas arboricola TaxID=56448 RepID=UPI0015588D58|nr:hypothetical protein [Xanthomonas arboricola]
MVHADSEHRPRPPGQQGLRSVQRVTDIMREITSASRERAAGIAQVTQTITQMDETTQ